MQCLCKLYHSKCLKIKTLVGCVYIEDNMKHCQGITVLCQVAPLFGFLSEQLYFDQTRVPFSQHMACSDDCEKILREQ